jgi:hypothetical protein
VTKKILHLLGSRAAKGILAALLLLFALWVSGLEAVGSRLLSFPFASLAFILLLLLANLWLVAFRYWRILVHFSYRVSFATASRATLAGHLAGLLVFSLLGQVVGRQAVLRQIGITPVVNSTLAGYERGLLVVVSGMLAFLSGAYLLGQELVNDFFHRIPVIEIVALMLFSLIVSIKVGGTDFESRMMSRALTARNMAHVGFICGLTVVSQFLVLASFVVAIVALQPDAHLVGVFAAAALISFAASMPITINGWGVREIASVFVLGKLGIPAADAITCSILIGLSSTLVILAASPLTFLKKPASRSVTNRDAVVPSMVPGLEKAAAWLLGMAVALMVFFQIHVELNGGFLSLNLADPFAILALTTVALYCVMQHRLPQWRLLAFNKILLVLSAMLTLGFVVGVFEVGVTQWALAGRLLGWLVLLGYLSAGYLLVAFAGNKGLRRLMETLAVVAAAIVFWEATHRLLATLGFEIGEPPGYNFEAFSGNRNALAFQILSVMSLLLAYSQLFANAAGALRLRKRIFETALIGIMLAGLAWTGSRAGWLAGGAVLLAGVAGGMLRWRTLIQSGLAACALWFGFWLAPDLLGADGSHWSQVQSFISGDDSNTERWKTWTEAIRLWLDSPIWGAGLGVFLAKSGEWLSRPQVVHSTPLWVLAEFGLIGIAVIVWSARKFLGYFRATASTPSSPHRWALIYLLLGFAVFGLFHEIFYQRIMWLILGAAMALPGSVARPGKGDGQ